MGTAIILGIIAFIVVIFALNGLKVVPQSETKGRTVERTFTVAQLSERIRGYVAFGKIFTLAERNVSQDRAPLEQRRPRQTELPEMAVFSGRENP